MRKNVALIFGGEGAESEISVRSAANLYSYIDKGTYRVLPIFITREGEWHLTDEVSCDCKRYKSVYPVRYKGESGLLCDGEILSVDAAIPLLHGDFGEDGKIQGALDAAHIRYVGCGVASGAACADKILTKIIADGLGIPTAEWTWSDDGAGVARAVAEARLGYPMFIKPATLGSSIGAAAVNRPDEFTAAYNTAASYGRVLIERLMPVEYEVECAVLQYGGKLMINPGGTVETDGALYGFEAKYNGVNSPKTSHGVEESPIRCKISEMARRLAEAIGIRHMARIDFFVTRDGKIYFNEINTMPGMTATSLYPALTEGMNLLRGEFINLLLAEITA